MAFLLFFAGIGAAEAALPGYDHAHFRVESDSPVFFSHGTPTYYLHLLADELEYVNGAHLERLGIGTTSRVLIQVLGRGNPKLWHGNVRAPTDEEWLIRIVEPGRTTELPGFRAPLHPGKNEVLEDQWTQLVIGGVSYVVARVILRFWENTALPWKKDAKLLREFVRQMSPQDHGGLHRPRLLGFLNRVLAENPPGCTGILSSDGLRWSAYLQAQWGTQLLTATQWEW